MNKKMDREAIKLIGLMELHLSHEYDNQEQKKADLDRLLADFFRLDAMPVEYFSQAVWLELNELFESYLALKVSNEK